MSESNAARWKTQIMRDHLLLYVNGQRHEIGGEQAFRSLAEFLRYDLGLTGTKIVCAEGDCGSCSVLLGRPTGNSIDYHAVCSCIQFLFQVDCTHIVTVEGLNPNGYLNAFQEAMVRCHGAQCGFCTPGIVTAMCAAREQSDRPDIRKALVGNLCRCTGYESIIRAGLETDFATMRPMNELYPPQGMLPEFKSQMANPLRIDADGRRFFKPTTIDAACRFKAEHTDCIIVSGGTDIGVQINKGLREFGRVLSLAGLPALREITHQSGMLIVGGAASLADLETVCITAMPELARLLYWFGSPPIKATATLAGNIATGSPIGDSMPALFVLDAEIELTGTLGALRVNINQFYTGYRRTVMSADEIITRIFIPLPAAGDILKLYKVSRRKDLDISAFTAAIWLRADDTTIHNARIACGGVAPTIVRLPRTEAMLSGAPRSLQTFAAAGKMARSEVRPISDLRGSMDYRLQLTENILTKFWYDIEEPGEMLSVDGNGQEQ